MGTSLRWTSLIVELQLGTWKTLGENPNFVDRVDGAEIPLINSYVVYPTCLVNEFFS